MSERAGRPGRPGASEYAPFYEAYVSKVPEAEVLPVLAAQVDEVRRLAAAVPAERERHRYAPGKWSVREVFGHLSDAERLFGYRALCIGRGDPTPLPGFDEVTYMAGAGFDGVPLAELAGELAAIRETNLLLLRRFDDAAWSRVGTANGTPVSVRALAYVMAGHLRHHVGILHERYGISTRAC
jgi:hypothetical protein